MPTFTPTLPLERELGKQIYQALQGPLVETILKTAKDIAEDEVGLIYSFGNKIGFSDKEISVIFAEMIQRNYVPSLESIC